MSMHEAAGARRRAMYEMKFIDSAETAWHLERSTRKTAMPEDDSFVSLQRERDKRKMDLQNNRAIIEEVLCDTTTTIPEEPWIDSLVRALGLPSH